MSFTELLQNLESLTQEQRQIVIERALEIDDSPLTPGQEQLVQERLEEYRRSPDTFLTLDELEKRLKTP